MILYRSMINKKFSEYDFVLLKAMPYFNKLRNANPALLAHGYRLSEQKQQIP